MSTFTKGHYHCLECGTLFEAEVVSLRDQRCPVCGNPPTGKVLAGTGLDRKAANEGKITPTDKHGVSADAKEIEEATRKAQSTCKDSRVSRKKRKVERNKKQFILIGVWLLLMVSAVIIVKIFNPPEDDSSDDADSVSEREQQELFEIQKRKRLIEAALPECEMAITDFLNASDAATKAQYVYMGQKLSAVMSRYYRSNPSFSSIRSRIRILNAQLLEHDELKVIGVLCRNSLGEKFEVVLIKTEREWQIDWLHLVRYDTRSWSLFPAGENGDEGEFRLYMRVRDTNEDLEQKHVSVVFYKPGIYVKKEFDGLASPAVSVEMNSALGQRILGLLEKQDAPEQNNGLFFLHENDRDGYHRVRVRMRLVKQVGVPHSFELLEILADDWRGIEQAKEGKIKGSHY